MEIIRKLIKALLPERTQPIFIFDLDGTLSDPHHREHLTHGPEPKWTAFFEAAIRDKPHGHVIFALRAALEVGCEILIWSGRSDEVRRETIHWLSHHLRLPESQISGMLRMRPAGDLTPDHELKRTWFALLEPEKRMRVQAVYEDRAKVVNMWRSIGVPCFQVAPGDF